MLLLLLSEILTLSFPTVASRHAGSGELVAEKYSVLFGEHITIFEVDNEYNVRISDYFLTFILLRSFSVFVLAMRSTERDFVFPNWQR